MLTKRVSFYRREFVLGFASLSRRPGRRSRRPAIAAVRVDARRGLKAAPAGGRGGLAGRHWRRRRAPGTQASSKRSAPRPSSSSSRRAGWSWLSSFEHAKRLSSSATRSVDTSWRCSSSLRTPRGSPRRISARPASRASFIREEDAAVQGGEVFAANRQKRAARARSARTRASEAGEQEWVVAGRWERHGGGSGSLTRDSEG